VDELSGSFFAIGYSHRLDGKTPRGFRQIVSNKKEHG